MYSVSHRNIFCDMYSFFGKISPEENLHIWPVDWIILLIVPPVKGYYKVKKPILPKHSPYVASNCSTVFKM